MFHPQTTITVSAAMRDLKSARPNTRAQAALALGDVVEKADREAAIEALIETLKDPRAEVRSAAASSLGELGGDRAVSALVAITEDKVSGTRQAAAIALGTSRAASAFAPLVKLLESGPPDLRFQAATSLAEVDPERAVAPLLAALSDNDLQVVSACALSLGACGDASAAPTLAARLDDASADLSFDIGYALARLGDERATPALLPFLRHKEHAWDAIEGLEMAGEESGANALAPLLSERRPREQRVRAAAAILVLAPEGPHAAAARDTLLGAINAWKHHLRALAVDQLARVGGPWARNALLQLASSRRGRFLAEEIQDALARTEADGLSDAKAGDRQAV